MTSEHLIYYLDRIDELEDVGVAIVENHVIDASKHIIGLVVMEGARLMRRSFIEYAKRSGVRDESISEARSRPKAFTTTAQHLRQAKQIALSIVSTPPDS